jgi:GNAT superfamily N-acetyltransferase
MTYGASKSLPTNLPITIRQCFNKADIEEFIEFPFRLYNSHPFFSPLLRRVQRVHFSADNPFYKRNIVRFYVAKRGKRVVGRIASIVNYNHLDYHRDSTGFFGFFESEDDPEVASALLAQVEEDLKAAGLQRMLGPMSFSTNEVCGVLIEGFNEPPMLMMPYNPTYYDQLLISVGLKKAKDLFAYIYELQEHLPEKVCRVADIAERRGIKVRKISKKGFMDDMRLFKQVYNSAWASNWCFVPITDEELDFTAKELKTIVNEDIVAIAEFHSRPIGFLGIIPDFNPVLRAMGGRLNPFTLIKALYAARKISAGRLLLFGIVPQYRNKGVDALLFREVHKVLIKTGIKRVEFSWILEDNIPTINMAEFFGGVLYKKYRIYEKLL